MRNGTGSPLSMVRFRSQAIGGATTSPSAYITNRVSPCRPTTPHTVCAGMNAEMNRTYTGSRALQLISGAIRIVAIRSRRLSMVRAAMMPGTAQANDDRSGMKLRPDSPKPAITRSIRKAARAM